MRSGACAMMHVWRSEDSLQWRGSSFHHVGPGNWTLVSRFDKRRYSLSRLTGPWFYFFETKSLPSLGWPHIHCIAQAGVKVFKCYLVCIFVCLFLCMPECICTLVHTCACMYILLFVWRPEEWVFFFFHHVGPHWSIKLGSKCLYPRASWL